MKAAATPRFIVVANPDCKRLALNRAALQKLGFKDPIVVFYSDLLDGRVQLQDVIRRGDRVRLESPGRNWEVEKALLSRGAEAASAEEKFNFLSARQVEELNFDKGRLWPSRQWYRGLTSLMNDLQAQLIQSESHQLTHCPTDILKFFDKPVCHAQLQSEAIPVPPALPIPSCFETFMNSLRAVGWRRAFLKLAHGSSAAGVVAFQTNGSQVRAVTTAEMVRESGETRIYNSRRLRTYETWGEVAELIDTLCRERLHVEKWFPKASLHGKICDARIVVIAGQVWEGVVRLSSSPLTNLHLLNERAPLAQLRAAMRKRDWQAMLESCEKTMALFPSTLTGGIDVVFSPDFRRHAILEINAWGDLLPGVLNNGKDTYEAQLEAVMSR